MRRRIFEAEPESATCIMRIAGIDLSDRRTGWGVDAVPPTMGAGRG
ncbi:hypothetical protein [Streptomyces sp. NBC_00102]|nr:hypothetical protein [Streptomyces sp. NBC_00102]MCX5402366.1 hypothetical protein [Streptomyces sp. NBC_00102]